MDAILKPNSHPYTVQSVFSSLRSEFDFGRLPRGTRTSVEVQKLYPDYWVYWTLQWERLEQNTVNNKQVRRGWSDKNRDEEIVWF